MTWPCLPPPPAYPPGADIPGITSVGKSSMPGMIKPPPGFFPGPEDADDGGDCGRPGGPPGLLFGPLGGCGGGKACTFVFVARFLSPSFCCTFIFFSALAPNPVHIHVLAVIVSNPFLYCSLSKSNAFSSASFNF